MVRLLLVAMLAAAPLQAAEQPYDGVVPGHAAKAKARKKGPNLVTWVGFQKTDGGPRVFLRLSSAVEGLTQDSAGDEVVVHVPRVKLDTRNNARPLDTRFFGTDVKRVWARQTGKGVDLHVRLAKPGAQAKLSTAVSDEGDGSVLVYVDFAG